MTLNLPPVIQFGKKPPAAAGAAPDEPWPQPGGPYPDGWYGEDEINPNHAPPQVLAAAETISSIGKDYLINVIVENLSFNPLHTVRAVVKHLKEQRQLAEARRILKAEGYIG